VTSVAILNPKSGSGNAAKIWARVQAQLREPYEVCETQAPGHATTLARNALDRGITTLVAIGGDGTINEIVNGFFDGERAVAPDARLGIVPSGTGSDLRRTLQLPSEDASLAAVLRAGHVQSVDVMKVRYATPSGASTVRYAVNIVSFGMGGLVAARAKESSRPLGGRAAYLTATLRTALTFRGRGVRLTLDGAPAIEATITNVAVGNGQFHGGGMWACPAACLDDGLIDVTLVNYLPLWQLVRALPALYTGRVLEHPSVRSHRARRLEAAGREPCEIELDGEAVGRLPIEVSVLPRAIRLLVPAKLSPESRGIAPSQALRC
jgi:YegS/Rv2252/BmrU family lipid kinase